MIYNCGLVYYYFISFSILFRIKGTGAYHRAEKWSSNATSKQNGIMRPMHFCKERPVIIHIIKFFNGFFSDEYVCRQRSLPIR